MTSPDSDDSIENADRKESGPQVHCPGHELRQRIGCDHILVPLSTEEGGFQLKALGAVKCWPAIFAAILWIALLGVGVDVARAAPYCAIRITVQSKEGRPAMGGMATARDPQGKIAGRASVSNGKAELCDLDFGVYTVAVEAFGSYPVEVRDVVLLPEQDQELMVILALHPFNGDRLGNACTVHLRVVSEQRKPIPGASLREGSRALSLSENGFATTLLNFRSTGKFLAEAPAYLPRSLDLECGGREFQQATIVLQRP